MHTLRSAFKFSCPKCGQHLSGDKGYVGRHICCPSCQSIIVVPEPIKPPRTHSFPSRKVVNSVFLSLHKHEFTYTDGPQVSFDCPGCQAQGVAGNTQGTRERFMSFGLIPLFRVHYTDVTCTRCGRSFRLHQRVETVATLAPEAIARGIRSGQIPFFIKFSIVTGVGLGVLPGFGLIFAAIGSIFMARKPSHWRTAAFVGLGLSLIATGVLVAVLLKSSTQNSDHYERGPRGIPSHFPGRR